MTHNLKSPIDEESWSERSVERITSKTWVVETRFYLTEYSLRRCIFWQFKNSEAERARRRYFSSVIAQLLMVKVDASTTSRAGEHIHRDYTKNPKQTSKQSGKRSSMHITSAVGNHTVRNTSGVEAGRAWPHKLRHSIGQMQLTAAHLAQDHFPDPLWWTGNSAVKQLILTKASALNI